MPFIHSSSIITPQTAFVFRLLAFFLSFFLSCLTNVNSCDNLIANLPFQNILAKELAEVEAAVAELNAITTAKQVMERFTLTLS